MSSNYLPASPDLNLFRKNEYYYLINDIEVELEEIKIGGILTKNNKLYAYDDSIRDYILDDVFPELKPYVDDKGKIKFKGGNFYTYAELFKDDKLYFLDKFCAESLLAKIKKLDDACKRGDLMKMISDLSNDKSSALLADLERKIASRQEILNAIYHTLVLELEKVQDTNVI